MDEDKKIMFEIKEKKEFSYISNGIIERVLNLPNVKKKKGKEKVKEARAMLRKYFSVFISNKLVKGKLEAEEILKKHLSTKTRDYKKLYEKIIQDEKTIIDLGAGLNGFSFPYMLEVNSEIRYFAVEAILPFVELMNDYFQEKKFNAFAVHGDLFNLSEIIHLIGKEKSPKAIFLFNVVDALELEWDYSKKFLLEIKKLIHNEDKIVLSFPTKSLSGKTNFKVKRYWLLDFLENEFRVEDNFDMNGEKFFVLRKK
jgi:hypothetical protein